MATVRRHYKNPPVVEALAELYFDGSAWDAFAPGAFYEQVREQLPNKGQLDLLALNVELGQSGPQTRVEPGETRVVLRSEDESRQVQVGQNVLVVNQLRPYPSFEVWSRVLLDMLKVYRDVAKPASIKQMGMRYINRIDIPLRYVQMEDYFKVYPQMPLELGVAHGDFLLRLQLPAKIKGHEILLTFAKAPPVSPGVQAFVLDLYDVVRLDHQDSFDVIEKRLNEAHENVEWVFENTLTEATRAIFGEVTDDRT